MIERVRNRDETAYIRLIEKYGRLMWKVARDILNGSADMADIEDCISEVFYKLWKSPEGLDPDNGNLKNYLARMTKNAAIDFLRKRSRENNVELDDTMFVGDGFSDVSDVIILNERKETVREIMDSMNDRDRELITRRFMDNQKPTQISIEMNIPVREVENRLYRIKGNIRKQISC
jgi:RNA polymerase sigma-70 factor (ECF subfamily)